MCLSFPLTICRFTEAHAVSPNCFCLSNVSRQLFPSRCCLCHTVPHFLEMRSVGRDHRFTCEGWPLSGRHVPATGAPASVWFTLRPHPVEVPAFLNTCHLSSQPWVTTCHVVVLPKMIYFFLPSFMSLTSWSGHVDCLHVSPLLLHTSKCGHPISWHPTGFHCALCSPMAQVGSPCQAVHSL